MSFRRCSSESGACQVASVADDTTSQKLPFGFWSKQYEHFKTIRLGYPTSPSQSCGNGTENSADEN